MIVGFAYKKNTGKNTIAKFVSTYLRCEYPKLSVKEISFAAKLKDVCYQLYGWAGLQRGIFYEFHREEKEVLLPKLGMSPRDIWINIGNAIRTVYAPTWIDFALKDAKAKVILITDVGFTNEAEAIKGVGGWLCKLNRDNISLGTDDREVQLDDWTRWNYIIDNNKSLSDLNSIAENIAKDIVKRINKC